jgi:AcrR family transcriptional regulator
MVFTVVNGVNLRHMTAEVKRRSGVHHGDLRPELERAAIDIVAESGIDRLTMAEVSRRAGVSTAAPYKHFADRDALLVALASRAYREQATRFSAALAGAADPADGMSRFARAYVDYATENRGLFEIAFGSGSAKRNSPELREAGDRVRAILLDGARKAARNEDAAMDLVYQVGAAAHGFATFAIAGTLNEETRPAAELAAQAALALCRGLT